MKVLIVDDDERMIRALQDILEFKGFSVDLAKDGEEALVKVNQKDFDALVLDIILPKKDGMEVLKEVVTKKPQLPVIVISGHGTIRLAVESTKLGAYDFLEKPLDAERVLITLKNAVEKYRLEKKVHSLIRDSLERYKMIGKSQAIRNIFKTIEQAAPTHGRILIQGESGTGKELVARAIHHLSTRSDGPFVRLNCASIPEELIESELFGYKKGAFTGAGTDKEGLFKAANGGTLFLDEIGDMSLRAQAKVLRAIEEGEIQKLGGVDFEQVDARIIAATNKKLEQLIVEKKFREDLYYRLNVVTIYVPPLRERKEDIPALITHFNKLFSDENNVKRRVFTTDAIILFVEYDWPGNIRELKNVVEYLVVVSDKEVIDQQLAFQAIYRNENYAQKTYFSNRNITLREARESFEKEMILNRLAALNWNISRTAKELGLDRTNLYKKMMRYGIQSH
ncbi:MAG: sigma-54-dependent Fis family transcriptional regulator [Calditrichaeota bacterium]|nr:sigma-54-dependent Fis family transcriptional regulator [Calditrichota bacterium]